MYKTTMLSGDGFIYILAGHWAINSVKNYVKRQKKTGAFGVTHCSFDTSGKGRSGHDGRWLIGPRGKVTKAASWKEYGVEHI